MNKYLIIIIFATFYNNLIGQEVETLYPIKENNLYGYIDKTGKIIIKPKFNTVNYFSDSLAAVRLNGKYGFIDMNGNFVVKPIYDLALNFNDGIAKVYLDSLPYFINKNGEIQLDSIVYYYDKKTNYKGAINQKSELIFSDKKWKKITPFSCNRAFARDTNDIWYLIDTKGNIINPKSINKIYEIYNEDRELKNIFENGIALIEVKEGWVAIDTTGKFITKPFYLEETEFHIIERIGDIAFMLEYYRNEENESHYRYGFWNTKENIVIKPKFEFIDIGNYKKGQFINFVQDNQNGYVNLDGHIIWQAKSGDKVNKLNIDYMNRGYFYASSVYKVELSGFGGWGSSKNNSKKVNSNFQFLPNSLQVHIDTSSISNWMESYNAYNLYVINTSIDTSYFNAQDSRINLIIQAKDKNGLWKDIEYLPSSWCGNSYHTLFIAQKEYWEFTTPIYYGELKTKLRAKLYYKKSPKQKKENIIYSNEIDGSINPGQFWNKRKYNPNGIMDPYDE